jgi:glycosyltransferase involved in cell wall biosynthesis
MSSAPLRLSVIIPVHNEAELLEGRVARVLSLLDELEPRAELLLVENGSSDDTGARCERLASRDPRVRVVRLPRADYGAALLEGLELARGRWAICDEIDLGDGAFYRAALELLAAGGADLVVGSKRLEPAADQRPWSRRVATRAYGAMLLLLLGYRGSDTHGAKAMDIEALRPVLSRCATGRDVFASELVVRAHRMGKKVEELPLRVRELRPPARPLIQRVPGAVWDALYLAVVLGRSGGRSP